jgi:hypothetical protein
LKFDFLGAIDRLKRGFGGSGVEGSEKFSTRIFGELAQGAFI